MAGSCSIGAGGRCLVWFVPVLGEASPVRHGCGCLRVVCGWWGVVGVRTHRRFITALSAAGIRAIRDVYLLRAPDVVRVAVLVEISAAAASLARTIVKLRHLDLEQVAPLRD